MKDLLEPFLYPHNLLLYALLLACICYRKKGLWLIFVCYYLVGNTYLANQARLWYQQGIAAPKQAASLYVVLGCGGSAKHLPACAAARIQQLKQEFTPGQLPAVILTTRYCQPYLDYLQQQLPQVVADCFDAGDNTYQEFANLVPRLAQQRQIRFITSDFHSWRVSRLINEYQLDASIGAASTQTLRPVNCSLNCFFTVNLSNLDFYSKLTAEFSSYAVYKLGGRKLTGA
jgi:hypothetical protein